ncbi:TOBE domain-containing protein, partial [Coraliomargarita sp. SDUM461003]
MGDRICVMKDGNIMQVDEPLKLYNDPQNMFVASFIGSPPMNFFPGACFEDGDSHYFAEDPSEDGEAFTLKLEGHMVSAAKKQGTQPAVFGVRPEDIEVSGEKSESSITAIIDVAEPMGAETYLYLNTPTGRAFIAKVQAEHAFAIGQTVHLKFNQERTALFDQASENVVKGA